MSEPNPPTDLSSPSAESFGTMPASEGGPSVPGQPTFGAPPVFDSPAAPAESTFGSPPPAPPEPMPAATGADTGAAAAAPADTTDAPAKKRRGGGLWGYLVVLVVILAIGAVYYFSSRNDATKAQVGQCLAGTSTAELNADHLKIVDCGSSEATFKVLKRVENTLSKDSNPACNDEPSTSYVFWSGKENEKGTVLCLTAVAK